jgi:nucleotide-binding universal stress UspA family protein
LRVERCGKHWNLEFGKTSAAAYSAIAAREAAVETTSMYQHILVAIDESATSELALKEAVQLAKALDATLRLAHVIDDASAYSAVLMPHEVAPQEIVERQASIRRFGEDVLSRAAATARALGANVETTLLTVAEASDRVYDAIEQEAVRWPAGLVVIGTHGRRGYRRLILGSVAEGLMRITTKPVLLVRAVGPWVT